MTATSSIGKARASHAAPPIFVGVAQVVVAVLTSLILVICVWFAILSLAGERDRKIVDESVQPIEQLKSLQKFPADDRQRLITREEHEFLDDPLDATILKNLSFLSKADSDDDRSHALALLLGDRSLRDTQAQADALAILLERKDYAGALYRLDGLLRSKPAPRGAEVANAIALFVESPESMEPLAAALAKNPPWRPRVMQAIVGRPNGAAVYGLFSALRKTSSPPTLAELRAFLASVIGRRNFELAYYVWLDFLSEVELRKVANIYDGGFDLPAKNRYFDWTFESLKNTQIRIVPRATSSSDRMLRIAFVNLRERFMHVSQMLRLPPGSYVLSGETKAENLETDAGLVWRMYCLDDGEKQIGASAKIMTAEVWAGFDAEVIIPPEGCATQRLRLEVDAKAVLDQKISGTIFFDQMNLRKK